MPKPNILFIVADDTLPDQFNPDFMPYMASEPEGHWIKFEKSLSETPLCAPARVTIFTGQTARRNGVRSNVDADVARDAGLDVARMLPAALRRVGYYTVMHGKYLNGYPWDMPSNYVAGGWSDWHSPGGAGFFGNRMNNNGVWSEYADEDTHVADLMDGYIVQTLETAPEPFFCYIGHRLPHKPSEPAIRHQDYQAGYVFDKAPNYNEADPTNSKPSWFRRNTPDRAIDATTSHPSVPFTQPQLDQIEAHRLDAARCNKGLDESIENMIEALSNRGILDNTIIIFIGDNSNCFGEHRHNTKGVPYWESINQWLRVRYPGATPRVSDALVSNIDFAPTILDLAGARPRLSMQGMSFKGLLDGTQADEDFRQDVLIQRGQEPDPIQFGPGTYDGVQTYDGWKYILYAENEEEELYDLTADPYEMTNLAAVPEHADRKADLRRRLETILAANSLSVGL